MSTIKAATTVENLDYTDQSKQLNNPQLFVGFSTGQVGDKLVREGDIDETRRSILPSSQKVL